MLRRGGSSPTRPRPSTASGPRCRDAAAVERLARAKGRSTKPLPPGRRRPRRGGGRRRPRRGPPPASPTCSGLAADVRRAGAPGAPGARDRRDRHRRSASPGPRSRGRSRARRAALIVSTSGRTSRDDRRPIGSRRSRRKARRGSTGCSTRVRRPAGCRAPSSQSSAERSGSSVPERPARGGGARLARRGAVICPDRPWAGRSSHSAPSATLPAARSGWVTLAPPYDLVSQEQRDDCSTAAPTTSSTYAGERRPGDGRRRRTSTYRAGETWRAWLDKACCAVIRRRRALPPRAELHRRSTVRSFKRRGFMAAVRLTVPGRRHRHAEKTLVAPKADWLEVLKHVEANLSPILGLYRDDAGVTAWCSTRRPRPAHRRDRLRRRGHHRMSDSEICARLRRSGSRARQRIHRRRAPPLRDRPRVTGELDEQQPGLPPPRTAATTTSSCSCAP